MTATAAVLVVGICDPDHTMIRQMLTDHFDVEVDRVMFVDDAVARMKQRRYRLVLVNRLIFEDGSDGLELLRRARDERLLSDVPIMMISNYSEAQERAVKAGAVPGFGKVAIRDRSTTELLSRHLPLKTTDSIPE
jgi:CheY-like chemotaxis protein